MGLILGSRLMTIPAGVLTVRAPRSAAAAAGWWVVAGKTCVAAYQPKGAASYAASKGNLADPGTHDATDGAAYPTWDVSTGWTFNGSTQYIVTDVTPARDQTWSLFVRYVDAAWRTDDWETLAGSFSTSGGNSGFLFHGRDDPAPAVEDREIWTGTTTAMSTATLPLSGVYGLAGRVSYLDGTADLTAPSGAAAGNHLAVWLGGLNLDGGLAQPMSGAILAAALYSSTLTAGEAATLAATMAAL